MTSLHDDSGRGVTRLSWLLLVVALATSVWLATRPVPRPRVPELDLMSAVPPGPALLVSVDVAALGEAAALELLRAGGRGLLGLRETCGFEPLLGLRQLVFAMPKSEPGESPDFALIARTSLDVEPVLRCAEAVIAKRGGIPQRSNLGRFRSVRDQRKPLGEIAIRDDGLLVLSGGRYFRDVVDAASGRSEADAAARERAAQHTRLRSHLEPFQLAVTLLDGPGFPIQGVRAVGASLSLGNALTLRGFVDCYSVAGCGEAQYVIDKVKADLAAEPGLAPLAQVRLEQREAELSLVAQLPREQLVPLLSQLLAP